MPERQIILVDDEPEADAIIRQRLAEAGFTGRIETLGTVRTATDFLLRELSHGGQTPPCVLLDLSLPDGHGFEILRLLRSDPRGASWFVAVVTNFTDPADRDGAFSLGADRFLGKYPSTEAIRALLEDARAPRSRPS